MNAAIYCRVSTSDQEERGTSLSTQLAACEKYCSEKQYVISRRYSETYSGLSIDRPKLNELRELVRNKQIDTIVIYCLDRFTRDPTHGVILTQELEKYGVSLESVTETIETSEIGKLISYIRGVASKLEAEKIKERTARGRKAILDSGRLPLCCHIYGYKWDKPTKRRLINEDEAQVIRLMFEKAAKGVYIRQIVDWLNTSKIPTKYGKAPWQDKVVRDILKNPLYYGETTYGKTSGSYKTKIVQLSPDKWRNLSGVTPPIITKELYDQAQLFRKTYADRFTPEPKRKFLLTGHVFCAECGGRMNGLGANKISENTYYRCRSVARGKTCSNYTCTRTDKLDEHVWAKVYDILMHRDKLLAEFKRQQQEAEHPAQVIDRSAILKKKLKALPAQEENLKSSLRRATELGLQDDVLDELAKIKAERQAIEKELTGLTEQKKHLVKLNAAQLGITELLDRIGSLEDCPYEYKRLALLHLGIRADISKEGCHLTCAVPLDSEPNETSRVSKSWIISSSETIAITVLRPRV